MGGVTYTEKPGQLRDLPNRTFSLYDLILPQMEQGSIYNAINFMTVAGGTDEKGIDGGAVNHNRFGFADRFVSSALRTLQQTPYAYPTQSLNGSPSSRTAGSMGRSISFTGIAAAPRARHSVDHAPRRMTWKSTRMEPS